MRFFKALGVVLCVGVVAPSVVLGGAGLAAAEEKRCVSVFDCSQGSDGGGTKPKPGPGPGPGDGGDGDGPPPGFFVECPTILMIMEKDMSAYGQSFEPLTGRNWNTFYALQRLVTLYDTSCDFREPDRTFEDTPLPRTDPVVVFKGPCITERGGGLEGPFMPPATPGGTMVPVYTAGGKKVTKIYYNKKKQGQTAFGRNPATNWGGCLTAGAFSHGWEVDPTALPYGRYNGTLNIKYRDVTIIQYPSQPTVYGGKAGTSEALKIGGETPRVKVARATINCGGIRVVPGQAWGDYVDGYYSLNFCGNGSPVNVTCRPAAGQPTYLLADGARFRNQANTVPVPANNRFTSVTWQVPVPNITGGGTWTPAGPVAVKYYLSSKLGDNSPSLRTDLYKSAGVNSSQQPYTLASLQNPASDLTQKVETMGLRDWLGFAGQLPGATVPLTVDPDSDTLSRNGFKVAFSDASVAGRSWKTLPLWATAGTVTAVMPNTGSLLWSNAPSDGPLTAVAGSGSSRVTFPTTLLCVGKTSSLSAYRVAVTR